MFSLKSMINLLSWVHYEGNIVTGEHRMFFSAPNLFDLPADPVS